MALNTDKNVKLYYSIKEVADSHGQQSVSGAMFGQCDSFAHLRFSFYNVCSLSFGWVCDFFCSSAALLSFNFFSTDSFSGVLLEPLSQILFFNNINIFLNLSTNY